MKTIKFTGLLILSIIAVTFYHCKTEQIVLHGGLTGLVADAFTTQPLEGASVKLVQSSDSTSTGSDGKYQFESLNPGNYIIQASKSGYASRIEYGTVVTASTDTISDIQLYPLPRLSNTALDFGFDSTSGSFTISYAGKKKLTYLLTPTQDWITVYPRSGELKTGTDTINITINRTGLSDSTYKEAIIMTSIIPEISIPEIQVGVYLNGVMDKDENYYRIVKIGNQIWMAENLNVGTQISDLDIKASTSAFQKYCYNGNNHNCDIYGGLYSWTEVMQNNPADNKDIGSTQGVCPDGWHIPTRSEYVTMIVFLGGYNVAGGKLKETGTEHWMSPNVGATNSSGFSALPGGNRTSPNNYYTIGTKGNYWCASNYGGSPNAFEISSGTTEIQQLKVTTVQSFSVRCVKHTSKK